MKEKRDETIILRLSKTEKNRIYEKMLSMGIRSLSAYIRKMALDGYCLNLDLPQLRPVSLSIRYNTSCYCQLSLLCILVFNYSIPYFFCCAKILFSVTFFK